MLSALSTVGETETVPARTAGTEGNADFCDRGVIELEYDGFPVKNPTEVQEFSG
jgi:hypothetical protein